MIQKFSFYTVRPTKISLESTGVFKSAVARKCNSFKYYYRFQGMRIRYYQDEMYLFDLSADERFAPMKKDENGKRIVTAPVLPEHWNDSYGMSVEEHDMSTKVDFLDGFLTASEVTEEESAPVPEEIE
jgi:hypothetical protein